MPELTEPQIESLLAAAKEFRDRAYTPYSGFKVGAALLGPEGKIFGGCNVENASYGLCICAERTALVSAVAAGERRFQGIAVIADTPGPVSPCGACRQFLVEFAPAMPVILANLKGNRMVTTAGELLPGHFGPSDLDVER